MKQCTLIIKDEVNIKLDGLDIGTRRKISKELEYFLQHARHTPAFKLGRWNGMVSYCDIGGRTFLNLLDRILPIVQDAGYLVDIEDLRIPHTFTFDEVDNNSYANIAWPAGHPMAGEPITLRDHQVDMINTFVGNPQCLNICPTAGGKTIVTAILSHKVEKYGRSVVIVPTKDLVTQTEEDYINMGLDVGVYFGDRKEYGKTHTVCTWQSLDVMSKAKDGSMEKFIDDVVCVMVDECFAPGTQVLTPTGYVAVETLQSGDKVINYSEKTQTFKEDVVVKLHKNLTHTKSERMYALEMDNGKVIKVTGNHKFLTENRGWVRADELTTDDEIVDFDK